MKTKWEVGGGGSIQECEASGYFELRGINIDDKDVSETLHG